MPAEPPAKAETTGWAGTLGAGLPVALTAAATALAGLSTSEMTQAMFWRGGAAQDQAKATSQWTLAGFKRDRALIAQTAAAQLSAVSGDAKPAFRPPADGSAVERTAADWLVGNGPPKVSLPPVADERISELLTAVRGRKPEAEVLALAARIPVAAIGKAVDDAEAAVDQAERDWGPVIDAALAMAPAAGSSVPAARTAGLELEQRRYRGEASLNQGVGFLYDARVRVLTAQSERHKERSKNFFYAMLAAQLGATLASLGLARQRRSVFWAAAGLAGLAAVGFGTYVYLGM